MNTSKASPSSSASSPLSEPPRNAVGRRVWVLLLVLLGAGLSAQGQVTIIRAEESIIAAQLARDVYAVRERLKAARRDLPTMKSPSGEQIYVRPLVEGLVVRTAADLDQAIQNTREPGLDALRDWATVEIDRLRGELGEPAPIPSAARLARPSAPYPVAVLAGLAPFVGVSGAEAERRSEGLAAPIPANPAPEGISRKTADGVFDQLAEVIKTVFVLAKKAKLQITVKLTLEPKNEKNLVLFPSKQLCDDDKKRDLTRGPNRAVWRGLYRYEPGTKRLRDKPCQDRQRDWPWTLDLVRNGGKIDCDFAEQAADYPCRVR